MGQALGSNDKVDVEIFAIGTMISRVAAPGLGIVLDLAFEMRAIRVVKLEPELHTKLTLVGLKQIIQREV